MQFSWPDIGVIAALLTAAAAVISYMVKNESRILKFEIMGLTTRVNKMDIVLERLADFGGQLGVMQERLLQTGRRQDEADKRANEISRKLSTLFENHRPLRPND